MKILPGPFCRLPTRLAKSCLEHELDQHDVHRWVVPQIDRECGHKPVRYPEV